ncbi:MAG: HD domain-containing protein [Prolixibacteraceae bacterium]|nr:HD domain-containing protein [Prolixibacteraceae bacterium]
MARNAEEKYNSGFEPEISAERFNSISNAVFNYMNSFSSDDEFIQKNLLLKQEHITRVIGYSEVISRSLECNEHETRIVLLAALLHDIGRFEQFIRYKTFNDTLSVDHALFGLEIIDKEGWLNELEPVVSTCIKKAIENHNKRIIPTTDLKEHQFFSKILRDADKLDILDLAIAEYSPKNKNKNEAFTLGLEKSLKVTKSVSDYVIAGKLPDKKDLKTINDFKLLQMAYVFDLNFRVSFSIVNNKQFLKHLFETLPKSDHIFEAYRIAKIHVENQLI